MLVGVAVASNVGLTGVCMADLAVAATALIAPAVGDVAAQLITNYCSSWWARLVTGWLLGLGIIPTGRIITLMSVGDCWR